MTTQLSRQLLTWYDQNARRLPWRGETDPYRIWVSEIMLQQTRTETVIPYYLRWFVRFPSLEVLANAPVQAVLHIWEGLGYYKRARSLHRAAQIIVNEMDGRFPVDRQGLEQLPGVGRYTAGAIASIAFGLDEPALDGNIRRVLSRVFNLELPARSPQGEKQLWGYAFGNLPPGRAGDYNQALMDLGAIICTRRAPVCQRCPLNNLCQARQFGVQEARPVTRPRPAVPHYLVTAAVIRQDGRVLIARRPEDGLLGGLWEFPGGKVEAGENLPEGLRREIQEELAVQITVGESLGVYKHAYTHFRVTLYAFFCQLTGGEPYPVEASELSWVTPSELKDYPMGKIDRQIAMKLERREWDS
ncbi:MAG TPA: A/G-specific adenine glycosylase [Levilinea sp.]|nr:A/G-specific adenine glycosylase [Levilinea sp.]